MSTIFLEKIRAPDQQGLLRPRLAAKLTGLLPAAREPTTLALILGPPGAGKTTLLSHLSAQAEVSAWYRATADDDSEAALTVHLGHALGAALGDVGLIQTAASGRIDEFIQALDREARHSVQLVVDDLHEIVGTAAEAALETFLNMRPRSIKVILGSRRPPQINTSRLLVSGELVELHGDDLRFRSWEVEELFRNVYRAPLTPEGAAALARRTAGWAAGLRLFALATSHMAKSERERAIDGLAGRSKLIRSYLARNVLDAIDPVRHRFLLLTSTLGILTGDLCDRLLGISGSARTLALLEQEQLFTSSTDGGVTYRYHPVLQSQLEVLLIDELGIARTRDLYRRSGELLEADGRIGAAMSAYARADEWGAVARLLGRGNTPVRGDEALWGGLSLARVPRDDPVLIQAAARMLARRGHLEQAMSAYRQAEELLDDPVFRGRCADERRLVASWLPGASGDAQGSAAPTVMRELRALSRSTDVDFEEPLVRGLRLMIVGDLDAARTEFCVADHAPGWPMLAARLADCWIDLLHEPDEAGAGRIETIGLEAEMEGWPWLALLARGLQRAMLLASDPQEWVFASSHEFLSTLRRQSDSWAEALTSLSMGLALTRAGRNDLAEPLFRRTVELAEHLDARSLRQWVETAKNTPAEPSGSPARSTTRRRDEPAPNATFVLRCLGGFSLTRNGTEIAWRDLRPRSRTLLMLLAINHGRPVHREQLIDALWPRATLAAGIRCLQVAVSSVRLCLGRESPDELIRRDGESYLLSLPRVEDQLNTFEHLAAEAARAAASTDALAMRTEALRLYTGDLLPEAGAAEWVVEERDRVRRLAASVATAAASDALQLDEPLAALGHARRSIELDPYHDVTWDLLADAYERLGDRAAAEATRQKQARIWVELGLV